MFKNFSLLSSELKKFTDKESRSKTEEIFEVIDALRDLVSTLPGSYSRAYASVQWMKYDQNGEPSDVTPDDQLSVPQAAIKSVQSQVETLVNRLAALASGGTTGAVVPVLHTYLSIGGGACMAEDPDNPGFTKVYDAISGLADPKAQVAYYVADTVSNNSLMYAIDGQSVTSNPGVIRTGLSYFFLNGYLGTAFTIRNTTTGETILAGSATAEGRLTIILPTNGSGFTDSSGATIKRYSVNAPSQSGATGTNRFLSIIQTMVNTALSGSGVSLVTSDANYSEVNFRVLLPSATVSDYNVTVPDIDITTFVNNYAGLLTAVRDL